MRLQGGETGLNRRKEGLLDFNEVNRKKEKKKKTSEQSGESFIMKPKKKRVWILILILGLAVLSGVLALLVARSNNQLRVTNVVVSDEQVPEKFDGFRILQLSDFYGKTFGKENHRLTELVATLDFDIVLLTGDFLDAAGDQDSFAPVESLLKKFSELEKPVYYVLGENDVDPPEKESEGWMRCIENTSGNPVAARLEAYGAKCVYPLIVIERGDERIFLTGINYYEKLFDSYDFDSDKDFSICVTHAPVDYDVDKRLATVNRSGFREVDFDLSISGHTLGGQYRLPLLKTLYLEGRGLFPQEEFAYGLHKIQGRYSFITAGLGVRSGFRLCNKPEVAVIELRRLSQAVD